MKLLKNLLDEFNFWLDEKDKAIDNEDYLLAAQIQKKLERIVKKVNKIVAIPEKSSYIYVLNELRL